MSELDHILWGVPDLEKGVEDFRRRTGVRARPGGAHPGMGTRNALAGLGDVYLEIIAPDPEQPVGVGLGAELAALAGPRIQTFAVRTRDLGRRVKALAPLGIETRVVEMSRDRPDGRRLRWRIGLLLGHELGRLVPFLIEWGDSPHPAAELPAEATLVEVELQHPRAQQLARLADALELELPVRASDAERLRAALETPRGRVELVSA